MTTTVENVNSEKTSSVFSLKFLPWFICALGAIFYSYEYFLRILPSVMTGELMQHYNIGAAALGGLSAFYYYAYTPMQLPVGILMDRYGPRFLLTMSCLVCVVGSFLFIATDSLIVGMIGRFLVGFGSAFAFVGVLKLGTIWLPADKLGLISGLAAALGTVGGMTGDILLTSLIKSIGWQASVYYSSAFGVILTIMLWLFLRDKATTAENNVETIEEEKPKPVVQVSMSKIMSDLVKILKNPQIWINAAIGCLLYLPTTVFAELWGIPYFVQAKFYSPETAAFANSTIFLGFTFGAPLTGWISDRMGNRRLPLLVASIGAGTLFSILLYVPSVPPVFVFIGLFLMALLYGAHVLSFAIARELSPNSAAGTAMALTNMVFMLGGMCLQPLVGVLLDLRWSNTRLLDPHVYAPGDYQFALAIIPIGIFIAGILVYFLKETHGQVIIDEEETTS